MKHLRFDLREVHGDAVAEGTCAVIVGHRGPEIATLPAADRPRIDHRSPEARARREARRRPPAS